MGSLFDEWKKKNPDAWAESQARQQQKTTQRYNPTTKTTSVVERSTASSNIPSKPSVKPSSTARDILGSRSGLFSRVDIGKTLSVDTVARQTSARNAYSNRNKDLVSSGTGYNTANIHRQLLESELDDLDKKIATSKDPNLIRQYAEKAQEYNKYVMAQNESADKYNSIADRFDPEKSRDQSKYSSFDSSDRLLDRRVENAKGDLAKVQTQPVARATSASSALANAMQRNQQTSSAKIDLEQAQSNRYYNNLNTTAQSTEADIMNTPEYQEALAAIKARDNSAIGGRNVAAGTTMEQRQNKLTDEQLAVKAVLSAKGDPNAKTYNEYISRNAAAQVAQDDAQMLEDNPWMRPFAYIGGSMASGGALVGSAANALGRAVTGEYKPVDTNSDLYRGARLETQAQELMTGGIENKFAKFLADTGLSIVNYASKLPLGPTAALAAMSMDVAGTTAYDSLQRGATPDMAALNGLTAGAAEMIAERIPLQNLFKMAKSGNAALLTKDGIKGVLKQSGLEATEELATQYSQTLSDMAVMGDRSVWHQTYNNYLLQGLNEAQAKAKTNADLFIWQPLTAAAGGGLAGGLMGAGATVMSGGLSDKVKTTIETKPQMAADAKAEEPAAEQKPVAASKPKAAPKPKTSAKTKAAPAPAAETSAYVEAQQIAQELQTLPAQPTSPNETQQYAESSSVDGNLQAEAERYIEVQKRYEADKAKLKQQYKGSKNTAALNAALTQLKTVYAEDLSGFSNKAIVLAKEIVGSKKPAGKPKSAPKTPAETETAAYVEAQQITSPAKPVSNNVKAAPAKPAATTETEAYVEAQQKPDVAKPVAKKPKTTKANAATKTETDVYAEAQAIAEEIAPSEKKEPAVAKPKQPKSATSKLEKEAQRYITVKKQYEADVASVKKNLKGKELTSAISQLKTAYAGEISGFSAKAITMAEQQIKNKAKSKKITTASDVDAVVDEILSSTGRNTATKSPDGLKKQLAEMEAEYKKDIIEADLYYPTKKEANKKKEYLAWLEDSYTQRRTKLIKEQGGQANNIADNSPSIASPTVNNKITGKPVSPSTISLLERLNRNDDVSIEEILALPEVSKTLALSKNIPETINDNSPERQAIRQGVKDTLSKQGSYTGVDKSGNDLYNGNVRQGFHIDIVIGPPAAGKSSVLVNPLSQKYQSRVIDSDMVKVLLPGYDNGVGATSVHEESSMLNKELLIEALTSGDNIVLPTVGGDLEKLTAQIKKLSAEGYSVSVHLCELPINKAVGRSLSRYFEQGRFLDPSYVKSIGEAPTRTYEALREMEGFIDGYSRYYNDVKRGEAPILIEAGGEADRTWGTAMATDGERGGRHNGGNNGGRSLPKANETEQEQVAGEQPASSLPENTDITMEAPEATGESTPSMFGTNTMQKAGDAEVVSREISDVFADAKHNKLPNTEVVTLANDLVEKHGVDAVEREIYKEYSEKKMLSVVGNAAGAAVIEKLSEAGETDRAIELANKMLDSSIELGRAVQILSTISKKLPGGFVASINKRLHKAGLDPLNEEQISTVNSLQELSNKANDIAKMDKDEQAAALKEYTDKMDARYAKYTAKLFKLGRDKGDLDQFVELMIQQYGSEMMPASAMDKFRAFQRINLLLNPKTNMRNIEGNLLFMGVELGSNTIAPLFDKLLSKKTSQRTASVPKIGSGMVGLVDAKNDIKARIATGTLNLEGNKYNENEMGVGRVFNNKVLNALDKLTTGLLSGADMLFKGFREGDVIAQLKKVNPEMSDTEVQELAHELALEATFQNDTVVSDALIKFRKILSNESGVKKKGKGRSLGRTLAGIITYSTQPFAKTPANILVQILNYSPVGLLRGVVKAATVAKSGAKATVMAQRKAVDALSRGIVGSGLMGIGALLASAGKASGEDKDEKVFRQANGITDNSVKIQLDGKEYWADFSSLGPLPAAINLGASVYNELTGGDEGMTADKALSTVATLLTAPINDVSQDDLWTGITDMVEYLGAGEAEKAMSEIAADAATQFVPVGSFLRAITSIIDPYARETSGSNEAEWAINRVISSFPGLSTTLPKKYTALGKEKMRTPSNETLYERIVGSMISTANISEDLQDDPVMSELNRIYKHADSTSVLFKNAPYSLKDDDKVYDVVGDDRSEYQRIMGSSTYDAILDMLDSKNYNNASESDREKYVKAAFEYATESAKDNYAKTSDTGYPAPTIEYDFVDRAKEAGIAPGVSIIADKLVASVDTNADKAKAMLDIDGLSNKQKATLLEEVMPSNRESFVEKATDAILDGIGKEFIDIYDYKQSLVGTGDGQKAKVVAKINSLSISKSQKRWIIEALGYKF